MITPNILQLLQDNNLGTFVKNGTETGDRLLFLEKLPLEKEGVFIMSRGTPLQRGIRTTQSFDLYARGSDDIVGAQWLEEILIFFANNYPVCDLPAVDGISEARYTNTIIQPTSNLQNVGIDESDRVIYMVSAQITYNKEQ